MTNLKRGTRITYTFAAGKVVSGIILGTYAKDMPDWYRCELTDEYGTTRGGCHIGQITVTDNRHPAGRRGITSSHLDTKTRA